MNTASTPSSSGWYRRVRTGAAASVRTCPRALPLTRTATLAPKPEPLHPPRERRHPRHLAAGTGAAGLPGGGGISAMRTQPTPRPRVRMVVREPHWPGSPGDGQHRSGHARIAPLSQPID